MKRIEDKKKKVGAVNNFSRLSLVYKPLVVLINKIEIEIR